MPNPVPLVTRGFGKNQRVVTTGYGPLIRRVIEAVKVIGGSAVKAARRLPEILWTVYARLTDVNEHELLSDVSGLDKKIVDPNAPEPMIGAEFEDNRIIKKDSGIVIVAARVQSGKKER